MGSTGECLNCGTRLGGRYCPTCGQDATLALRPLPELVVEWSDAVLGWETRSGRTLRTLLTEPGRLREEYAAGHRAPWIHPLRLYLAANLVALTVFGATSGIIRTHFASLFAGEDARYSQFATVFLAISAAMVVLVPLAGAVQALVYRGLGRYYAEHLVYVLHVTAYCYLVEAAASAAQFLLVLVDAPAQAVVVARLCAHAAFVVYSYLAARRVYRLGVGETLLRMSLGSALMAPALATTAWLMSGGAF